MAVLEFERSLFLWPLAAALVAYWGYHVFLTLKVAFSPLHKIPAPWYAHYTHLVVKYHVIRGTRVNYIHALHQKYGPFVRLRPTEIIVSSLPHVKQVHHNVTTRFTKSPWYASFTDTDVSILGVFSMLDVKQHAARRKLFAPSFTNTAVLKYEGLIRGKVTMAVEKIKRDAEKEGMADVLKWFTFMTSDIIGTLCFGKGFNSLVEEEKTQYIKDLETITLVTGFRVELPWLFSVIKTLPLKAIHDVMAVRERFYVYGDQAVQNLKEHVETSGPEGPKTFFGQFLNQRKKEQYLTHAQISLEAANMIIAGTDTTSVTLTYLVWSVLHPRYMDVRKRLMAELQEVPLDASVADLGTVKYLKGLVHEGLRLFGAASGTLPRVPPLGGTELGGYFVPEGTTVSVQSYTMCRQEDIYENAERIIPERWDNPTQDMKDAWMPLGAGSRSCLGIHIAMSEMLLGTFLFFKTFPNAAIAPTTTDASMVMQDYFLMQPKAHRCEVTVGSGSTT